MNFISKKILGGLLLASAIPATLLMTSCASTVDAPFETGITEDTEKYYGEKITEHSFTTPEKVIRKTMLITAGGLINDKAFNQSAWESMLLYKQQAGITDKDTITYRITTDDGMLSSMYDQALDGGYKTWVLTGFQQGTLLQAWFNEGDNLQKFKDEKIVVVGVDWNGETFMPKGQFLGLGFKTEEPSWVVGYAASKFLSTTDKPYLSSFGGGIFDGVTDFNNGFLQGMLDWNIENPLNKVKFYSGNSQAETINLNTGFLVTPEAIQTIEGIVGIGEDVPQIILPVSGSLTTTTIDNINDKQSSQMVIGVDSDQSLAFPNDKGKFFSSVEKKVAVGVYKALILLAGIPLDFATCDTTDVGFQGKFVEGTANAFVKYGFDKGLVGYSSSTLSGPSVVQANKFLRDAFKIFTDTPPTFEKMTDASKNQDILDGIVVKINL